MLQHVLDVAKNPRLALCAPSYHRTIGTCLLQYLQGFGGAGNVAIHPQRYRQFALDLRNQFVTGFACVHLRAAAAVYRQGLYACIHGYFGNGGHIQVGIVPTQTGFQGNRHIHTLHNGL